MDYRSDLGKYALKSFFGHLGNPVQIRGRSVEVERVIVSVFVCGRRGPIWWLINVDVEMVTC